MIRFSIEKSLKSPKMTQKNSPELLKIAQIFSAENSKVLKKISYDNHPRGIVNELVFDEKVSKSPK